MRKVGEEPNCGQHTNVYMKWWNIVCKVNVYSHIVYNLEFTSSLVGRGTIRHACKFKKNLPSNWLKLFQVYIMHMNFVVFKQWWAESNLFRREQKWIIKPLCNPLLLNFNPFRWAFASKPMDFTPMSETHANNMRCRSSSSGHFRISNLKNRCAYRGCLVHYIIKKAKTGKTSRLEVSLLG